MIPYKEARKTRNNKRIIGWMAYICLYIDGKVMKLKPGNCKFWSFFYYSKQREPK